MAYDPSGRIKRIPAGVMLPPGTCCVCGTSGQQGSEFADLDTSVDFIGSLYLCDACSLAAASVFGGVAPIVEAALRDEINRLKKKLEVADSKVESLERVNESYRNVIGDIRGNGAGGVVDAPPYLLDSSSNDDPAPEPEPAEPEDAGDDAGDASEPDAEPDGIESDANDGEPEDAVDRAFEALVESQRDSVESPASSGTDGGKPTGRLFGES